MDDALQGLRQEVANAIATWPFEDGAEADYLREHYAGELQSTAEKHGLAIYERDGRLISYPSIVRIFPGDQAIGIDKKKVSTLRPSYLAAILVNNQKKQPRFRSEAFLEIPLQGLQAVCGTRRFAQGARDATGQDLRDFHQLAGE